LLGLVWRTIAFYAICILALIVLPAIAERFATNGHPDARSVLFAWMTLVSVAIATWVMVRWVDKLSWRDVGLDRRAAAPSLLVKGAVLGGLTIGVASLALIAVHMLRIDRTPSGSWWGQAGQSIVLLLPAAFFEELFIRGYVFAILRRAGGWKLALIVTSIVFGLLHVSNPGADAESILAVIVAGFFLGVILLVTKSLYAAGAAHFAWNWVMSGALHVAVSGLPSPDPDYRVVDSGPDWLTGGPWGPEGGIAAVIAMFLVLFYLYGRNSRHMEWNA
jgi:uncharacterized protein